MWGEIKVKYSAITSKKIAFSFDHETDFGYTQSSIMPKFEFSKFLVRGGLVVVRVAVRAKGVLFSIFGIFGVVFLDDFHGAFSRFFKVFRVSY